MPAFKIVAAVHKGVIRGRDQYLVTGFQQGTQAEVDQLADAVADEHPFRRGTGRTTTALLRGNCFARPRQALLLAIRFAQRQSLGDRLTNMCGRCEAEGTRIADVQADDFAAFGFEFAGAMTERAADFVSDLMEP